MSAVDEVARPDRGELVTIGPTPTPHGSLFPRYRSAVGRSRCSHLHKTPKTAASCRELGRGGVVAVFGRYGAHELERLIEDNPAAEIVTGWESFTAPNPAPRDPLPGRQHPAYMMGLEHGLQLRRLEERGETPGTWSPRPHVAEQCPRCGEQKLPDDYGLQPVGSAKTPNGLHCFSCGWDSRVHLTADLPRGVR